MTDKPPKFAMHPLLSLAAIVIIIAGIKEIAPILNIFLVALLLAVSVSPVLTWQIKRGWPKAVSLIVTIFIVLIVAGGLSTILGIAGNNMASKAPEYQERITELYKKGLDNLSERGIEIAEIKELDIFSPDRLVSFGTSFIENLFSTFGNVFFVLILMIFMLIEFADLTKKAEHGEFAEDSWQHRFGDISNDLKKYVSINAVTGLMTAVADVILMLIMGIDFAVIWGFLAFFFSFIPNIGFFLSVIPPALIALLEFGWVHCLILVIGFIVINAFIDNVIKPKFLGQEFNMSILLVFLSLLFWSWVLGAIGAILGVPLTMAVKRITEFMNSDMSSGHDEPPEEETALPSETGEESSTHT
ncbi:MAG: AI-2E family transporter [Deltaproteobacteria bacterium]